MAAGVLADGRGVACIECDETATTRGRDGTESRCTACVEGRVHPSGAITDRDIADLVMLVHAGRERTWSAVEWMEQPYSFHVAWRFLIPHIVGEFEDRKKALKDGRTA